jgi:hypothetical protein
MSINPNYLPPLGTAVTPSPGDIVVPQAPSGAVSNMAPVFNFDAGISSTQNVLQNVLQVDSAQEGADALPGTLAAAVVIQGCLSVQQNTWDSGSVGLPGSKFS